MARLPPNLDEPIDLTGFISRVLPNNITDKMLTDKIWRDSLWDYALDKLRESNKEFEEEQMYSSETLASSLEYIPIPEEPAWWKFW